MILGDDYIERLLDARREYIARDHLDGVMAVDAELRAAGHEPPEDDQPETARSEPEVETATKPTPRRNTARKPRTR